MSPRAQSRAVSFNLCNDGKIEIGLVDRVVPDNWESLGVVPTIHVIQRAGE